MPCREREACASGVRLLLCGLMFHPYRRMVCSAGRSAACSNHVLAQHNSVRCIPVVPGASACHHDVDHVFHAVSRFDGIETVFVQPFEDGRLEDVDHMGAQHDVAWCYSDFH